MIEQTTSQAKPKTQSRPLSAAAIALTRIINDSVMFALALAAIFTNITRGMVMGIEATTLSTLINGLILLCSITAFFLIRRGMSKLGTNVLIYSLIIGMFINSIFFENVGSFGLITTLFFTILTISRDYSFREGVTPVVATLIFGAAGLAFDTFFEGAAFRNPPAFGMGSVWGPTVIFVLLILYLNGQAVLNFFTSSKTDFLVRCRHTSLLDIAGAFQYAHSPANPHK